MKPAPPEVVDAAGMPQFGRFAGFAPCFDWQRLAPPFARGGWWRRFHHKRWHYAALAGAEVFCAAAIVDVGWTNTAFAYVFDRRARKVVASFSRDGLPGLTAAVAQDAQGTSRFRFPGARIELSAQGLVLDCPGMAFDVRFGGAAPVLLAVGQAEGGSVHATQKSGALALAGEVRAGATCWNMDGGCASYDYSNGLLGRDTAWRWASAHRMGLGFNLQAGYFGANENALWLNGELVPLGAVRFDYDAADPLAAWQVSTEDGLLDLRFTPEGARREDKNLIVAASRYVQPIGVFDGIVRRSPGGPPVRVEGLVGVTEDHRSRW
jgi:hypothetical protein